MQRERSVARGVECAALGRQVRPLPWRHRLPERAQELDARRAPVARIRRVEGRSRQPQERQFDTECDGHSVRCCRLHAARCLCALAGEFLLGQARLICRKSSAQKRSRRRQRCCGTCRLATPSAVFRRGPVGSTQQRLLHLLVQRRGDTI